MSVLTWAMTDSALDVATQMVSGKSVGIMGGIRWGEQLRCSWKFEKSVEAFTVFIMVKQRHGRAQTQPFCEWLT